jgi:hypothetical protein
MSESDTNVGLGMVPHKKSCRCDECEIDRLRQRIAELKADLKIADDMGHDLDEKLHWAEVKLREA